MSTPVTKIVKTVTIKPGEQFVLPPGANVTTVIGTVGSSGCTIPPPTELGCYYFRYELSGPGAGGSNAWENGIIEDVKINNTVSLINYNGYWTNEPTGSLPIESVLYSTGVFFNITTSVSSVGDAVFFTINFKLPISLKDVVFLHLKSSDNNEIFIPPLIREC